MLRKAGLKSWATPGGSCFAWLPGPLLLRKAGLKGSGCDPGQLLRLAAWAPVAPQGGA
ncbi:hypothetical protein [Paenibacillus taichungensis]|uniref:hypothetical protein n=1 Tax=Paenibacillus taichungensis TaxID=484184 RepID=UPI0015EBFF0B|nr:hypothetical protein [Paenibacillus taichungensis]